MELVKNMKISKREIQKTTPYGSTQSIIRGGGNWKSSWIILFPFGVNYDLFQYHECVYDLTNPKIWIQLQTTMYDFEISNLLLPACVERPLTHLKIIQRLNKWEQSLIWFIILVLFFFTSWLMRTFTLDSRL